MKNLVDFLVSYDSCIWDFDGVIKDSLEVKGIAFVDLFKKYADQNICKKILKDHQENIGESRTKKIPRYMKYCSLQVNDKSIKKFSEDYSNIVSEKVINSKWVEEVKGYLLNEFINKDFFLVSSTPHDELNIIVKKLNLDSRFKLICGSPLMKKEAFKIILRKYQGIKKKFIAIGDSSIDYLAAKDNSIDFLLRKTEFNSNLYEDNKLKSNSKWIFFGFN